VEPYIPPTDAYHIYQPESGQVYINHQIATGRHRRGTAPDSGTSFLVRDMVGLSDLYSHYNQPVLVPYPELHQAAGIIEIRKEAYRRPGSTEPVQTSFLYQYLP